MKNHVSDFSEFYFLSNGWLYLQFTDQINKFEIREIYRKDAKYSEND